MHNSWGCVLMRRDTCQRTYKCACMSGAPTPLPLHMHRYGVRSAPLQRETVPPAAGSSRSLADPQACAALAWVCVCRYWWMCPTRRLTERHVPTAEAFLLSARLNKGK